MQSNDELMLEQCRILLKQAAWRLQYHARMQNLRETPTLSEYHQTVCSFEEKIVSKIYVQELINLTCAKAL
jgi:hypothetical protein